MKLCFANLNNITYSAVIKDNILSVHVPMKDMFFQMLDQSSLEEKVQENFIFAFV